jgi:hypothetical protein
VLGLASGRQTRLFSAVVIVGQDGDIQHEELGATLVDEP